MSGTIILYGSVYGASRRYAQETARCLGVPCMSRKDVKSLAGYDTVLYIGGVYGGSISGLKKTAGRPDLGGKRLLIATVSLADPSDSATAENIRRTLSRQLPPELLAGAEIFHLRGAIDYARLHFVHRLLMGWLYRKVKDIPEEKKNSEIRTMIDTYNGQADYVDFETLAPIMAALSA